MFDSCPFPEKWEMYESLYFETLDPELAKEICVF